MNDEPVTTSKIEGEALNRESVQSSIQRQLGTAADKRRASLAEQGIAKMMVDLYRRLNFRELERGLAKSGAPRCTRIP